MLQILSSSLLFVGGHHHSTKLTDSELGSGGR